MFATHRFQAHLQSRLPSVTGTGFAPPFVACPVMHLMAASQQAQVQAIYRIAAERTREQLQQRRRRSRLPQFSLN